jgi:TatD DNase family protein
MLVDSHCHLHDAAFAGDLDAVLRRARNAEVTRMVTIGTSIAESHDAVALAAAHPGIWATVGVAPHEAQPFSDESLESLRALAQLPRVVALGEIGLDYHYDTWPRAGQRAVFERQLALAAELGKPVVIHNRDADADMLSMLRAHAAQRHAAGAQSPAQWPGPAQGARVSLGVMHCFSGDVEMAERCVALGFRISLAGPLTYPKPRALPDVARVLPLEALLVETDAPFLAPQGHRGKRNEPALVRAVAQKIAELRGVAFETVAQATALNAGDLFGLGNSLGASPSGILAHDESAEPDRAGTDMITDE